MSPTPKLLFAQILFKNYTEVVAVLLNTKSQELQYEKIQMQGPYKLEIFLPHICIRPYIKYKSKAPIKFRFGDL